jgi:hypothetical protein
MQQSGLRPSLCGATLAASTAPAGIARCKGALAMARTSEGPVVNLRTAAVVAILALASACTASSSQPLQQVRATNPTVTYTYSGDQELLQAAQNAALYCNQYASTPGPARIIANPNGANSVSFECGPKTPPLVAVQPAVAPNLTYTYRTDQELLGAARSADSYCATKASRQAVSNITTNTDGSKTVIFQCVPV